MESSAVAPALSIPAAYSSFFSYLRASSIRCVVFDMDCTLVSAHSGGSVARGAPLSAFIRALTPASRALIPLLLSHGYLVGVATFADELYASYRDGNGAAQVAGVELVRAVLEQLPCWSTPRSAAGAAASTAAAATAAPAHALEQLPIVTMNPDLYHEPGEARRSGGSKQGAAAAAEEQARMQGSSAASSSARPQSQLHQFFHAKVSALGFTPGHAHWSTVSAYPPRAYKNHHLLLIQHALQLERADQLLLVDDRDENVDAAREAGAHGLYLLPPRRGLTDADLHERNCRGPVRGEGNAKQKQQQQQQQQKL